MPVLDSHNGYYLWSYLPSRPAAVIFTILFLLLTAYHLFLLVKGKTWFCIPFVLGGIFETVGYIGRILAYDATGDLLPYVLQSTFILIAPVLFAASLYMTLSRIILAVHNGSQHAIISPRWLTRIFVAADIISFFIQAGGAGILVRNGSSKSSSQLGQSIIIGGLVFQLVAFAVFLSTAFSFNVRVRRHMDEWMVGEEGQRVPWQAFLVMLYVTSALIILRNIVRAIEYADGMNGYLMTHEWCLYALDGVPMVLTMVAFAWMYPYEIRRFGKYGCRVELRSQG